MLNDMSKICRDWLPAFRNITLAFLLVWIGLYANAQTTKTEREPNNDFTNSDQFDYDVLMKGTVGESDVMDHFRLPLTWHANISLQLSFTNNSDEDATVNFSMFHLLRTNTISTRSINVPAGETINETIDICGRADDQYFMRLENNGVQVDYENIWYPLNAATSRPNNNTRPNATLFAPNSNIEGGINYTKFDRPVFPNLGSNDRFEYFKTTMPSGALSDYNLYLMVQNNDCLPTTGFFVGMHYFLYRNAETTAFDEGIIGQGLPYLGTATKDISLAGLAPGDELTIYFRNLNSGAFKFDFSVSDVPPYNDPEDNCCVYNAVNLPENSYAGGNVGLYDEGAETFMDEYDTYKINMPFTGAVNFFVEVQNKECRSGYYSLSADILDKYGNEVGYLELMYSDWDPECNGIMKDTVKLRGLYPGEYFIRLHTRNSADGHWELNYRFKYQAVDSTGNIDTEPNNENETAVLLDPGDTAKGNINFIHNPVFWDQSDNYKITITEPARLVLHSKITYRGDNEIFLDSDYNLRINLSGSVGGNFNYPWNHLTMTEPILPDSVFEYSDTLDCPAMPGNVFLNITTYYGTKYEYAFWFELLPEPAYATWTNDAEPNDLRSQAIIVSSGESKNGHIGYNSSSNFDSYDYYRINFPAADTFRISLEAINTGCSTGTGSIGITGYRNALTSVLFTAGSGNVAKGDTARFTYKRAVVAGDYIDFRINSSGRFVYRFNMGLIKPGSGFIIAGDTTPCYGPYPYKARQIEGEQLTYNWSLPDGGGTISVADSIATVNWTEPGIKRVRLFLSNAAGISSTKEIQVVVNADNPTQTPIILHFARQLSVEALPPGVNCQWYRNNLKITGATQNKYYALLSGSYTVKFVNDCGEGPSSNPFVIAADAITQSITFTAIPSTPMVPGLSFRLTGSSSSGLPVFYQKISGPPALIQNDTLFPNGSVTAGTYVIRISQPGNDIFSPATDVDLTIIITKGEQVIEIPEIPDQILNDSLLFLPQRSTANLNIGYSIVGGVGLAQAISNSSYRIRKLGVGTVTVRGSQSGNASYNPATQVERSFCIGIRNLGEITGDANPCLNTYRYNAPRISGANYVWQLSGGGILTTNKDTAWVQWQTPGNHTLSVKANSPCDAAFSNTQELQITTSNNAPGLVTGMQPANGATDQQFPLRLSWAPASNTTLYDLYIWDTDNPQPTTPFVANLDDFFYILPNGSLPFNNTYNWKVVAKNPCSQTSGPIQQFAIIPLPDLVISDLQYPSTAISGQTITISWKVTNIGPGTTTVNQSWTDAIFFAKATSPTPNFGGIRWNPADFNNLVNDNRPLLAGSKSNISALEVGQSYTNSVQFTLPLNYSFPLYVYGMSNYNKNAKLQQNSYLNDTIVGATPINVTLLPTPDLRVDSVFAPVTTFSGSTINLTYRVKNYGVLTPSGRTWTDSIFISQNPIFDRSQAIPLHLPKQRGNYYPNAVEAHVLNSAQLQKDSMVTKSVEVVIPNFVFGTWFVYVKTNANEKANTTNNIYEGGFGDNNLGQAQLNVFLTPTPLLTVQSLTVPVSTASTTQPIGISWRIFNEGFRDNIEKNNGHWMSGVIGRCPCPGPQVPGTVCQGPPIYLDNPVQGTSYWEDKVYLSTVGTGLNTNSARLIGTINNGVENGAYRYPDVIRECGFGEKSYNTEAVIEPRSNFPKSLNFTVPQDLPEGSYYIYVHTNATKSVFEFPGTAQIERSAAPIIISRPDLIVSAISTPANSQGTETIAINYTVTNNGNGSVFNVLRKDRLYISNFSAFDASAQLVTTQEFTDNIEAGGSISKSMSYKIPANTSGNKYFYVITNYDSSFKETNYVNNRSSSTVTSISAANPADLIVLAVNLPDSSFTNFTNIVEYTVKNNGGGVTTASYTDSLFVSCSPLFNRATSYYVSKKIRTAVLLPDSVYTDTLMINTRFTYEINPCWPITKYGDAYFFVKTNADTASFEGSNVGNNIGGSTKKVLENPLIDHVVPFVTGNNSAAVGQNYGLAWQLKNQGYFPSLSGYYGLWYDGVYFSPDSVWQTTDALAANYLRWGKLGRNQIMDDAKTVQVPDLAAGNYYVIVKTNSTSSIKGELDETNNTNLLRNADGTAKAITINRPPLSDLKIELLNAPQRLTQGEAGFIRYRVSNQGTGATFPSSIQSQLRLSSDFLANPNDGDRSLREQRKQIVLEAGENYIDSFAFSIPTTTTPGNYILIGFADNDKKILESNEKNNLGFAQIEILEQPVSDLIVENVIAPDTLILGERINQVKWTVSNNSPEIAAGSVIDGIYLTKDTTFDSTAVLMGTLSRRINLLPVTSRNDSLRPVVSGVVEGDYQLWVATDLLNNMVEENDENNRTAREIPVHVKARELVLETTEATTLHDLSKIYKLRIPDSLIGSTIMITLKSNDSLTRRNELYMGAYYVPTPAKYNYKFEIPNYGNQRIVMSEVNDTLYYIIATCVSPNPTVQQISLRAEVLPFALLTVNSNSGGNSGNATIKLDGSLFTSDMTARLKKGSTTIQASRIFFVNSTNAFATFNLQGAGIGLYDVVLEKPDGDEAILANGYSIVTSNNGGLITGSGPNYSSGNGNEPGCDPGAPSGRNAQLSLDLVVPERSLINRPVMIQIHFSNPTNNDIPAQTRILYTEEGLKLAYTKEDVPNGTTAMYIEIKESGGPPGIIRAGGSGTITLYTITPRTVPADPEILFKLQ